MQRPLIDKSAVDSSPGGDLFLYFGFWFAPTFFGITLLAAGLFKGHELTITPAIESSLFFPRWIIFSLVPFEIALGLWLLTGLYPKVLRFFALGCFAIFFVVALAQVISGKTSCGCFGKVPVHPWYTLVFDLTAVAIIWRWQPKKKLSLITKLHRCRLVSLFFFFLLVLPGALALGYYALILDDTHIIVLEPKTWVGQTFPLTKHINIHDNLKIGQWTVLLYHNDCPQCHEVIRFFKQHVAGLSNRNETRKIALIEMPPHRNLYSNPTLFNSPIIFGRLRDDFRWFVSTPVIIQINNGVVKSTVHGKEKNEYQFLLEK